MLGDNLKAAADVALNGMATALPEGSGLKLTVITALTAILASAC